MDVIIVLFSAFIFSALFFKTVKKNFRWHQSGNIAMVCMLFFTAVGHFLFPKGMALMIPPFIPARVELVYITGIMEIIFGILLLSLRWRKYAGIALIIFFIIILPANIHAALHSVNLKTAGFNGPGPGPGYLWFRVPLQIFFILWVYFFSVKTPNK